MVIQESFLALEGLNPSGLVVFNALDYTFYYPFFAFSAPVALFSPSANIRAGHGISIVLELVHMSHGGRSIIRYGDS